MPPVATGARPSKYGAKAVHDPRYGLFDSKAEHARWLELVALDAAGEILLDTTRQPVFVLSESPKCVYTPDFLYWEAGRPVVEDVKGATARDVFVRVCWLLQRFPDTTVRLVRRGRGPAKRGWREVAGWHVREYRREVKKRRRAA